MDRNGSTEEKRATWDDLSGVYLQLTCRHVQVPCAHPHGSRHCSFIDGVDLFDNKLFGLSLAETKGAMMGVVDGGCVPDTCNLKNTKNTGKGDQWRLCFGNDFRRSHGSFWQFVTPLWPFFFVNPPLNHSIVSSKNDTSSQIHPGFNNNTSPI